MNNAKLAYNAVAAWHEQGAAPPPALAAVPGLDANLKLQDGIAQTLRQKRHELGALTLESIEAQAIFDGEALSDLRPDEKNRAKDR